MCSQGQGTLRYNGVSQSQCASDSPEGHVQTFPGPTRSLRFSRYRTAPTLLLYSIAHLVALSFSLHLFQMHYFTAVFLENICQQPSSFQWSQCSLTQSGFRQTAHRVSEFSFEFRASALWDFPHFSFLLPPPLGSMGFSCATPMTISLGPYVYPLKRTQSQE